MSKIVLREDETIESALKRFRKKVDNEGILKKWKENQYFIKPSLKKRVKSKEARQRNKVKQLKKDRQTR